MKYNILLIKKDEKKIKKKMEHSLDFIIIIFSLVSISYSYYPIIENIALQDTWPIDQTDLLQSNLTP